MEPFRLDISEAEVRDLRERIEDTRWPGDLPGLGWRRGVPESYLRTLADHWHSGFDWWTVQKRINQYPQFRTTIDGATVHFVHVRSPEPDATPMMLLHGWPGSFAEFLDVIEPLTDPRRHGGDPARAFHLVIPSMPGHGPSSPLPGPGWGTARTARAWVELMDRLGYDRYLAQGGDVGSAIALELGRIDPDHVLGVHLSMLLTPPSGDPAELADLSPADAEALGALGRFDAELSGYLKVHSTRPQTLAYAMVDSPVGSLAWQVERLRDWSDCEEVPEEAIDRDLILTIASLYWFTGTAGSSTQFYFEDADQLPGAGAKGDPRPDITVPVAVAVSPRDVIKPLRRLADRDIPTLTRWTEFPRGGHFAAMEQPAALVADIRAFRGMLR